MSFIAYEPVPSFKALDGSPISGGMVHFGKYGLDPIDNPSPVFWDISCLVPVGDTKVPLTDGFFKKDNIPVNVYTKEPFSLAIADENGNIIKVALTPAPRTMEEPAPFVASVAAMKASGAPAGSLVQTSGFYVNSPYGRALYTVMTRASYDALRGNTNGPTHASNGGYNGVSYIDHLDGDTGNVYVHEGRFSNTYNFESIGARREANYTAAVYDNFPVYEAMRTGTSPSSTFLFGLAKFCHGDTVIMGVNHTWVGAGYGSFYGTAKEGTMIAPIGNAVPRIWTDRGGATPAEAYARPFSQFYTLYDPTLTPMVVVQPTCKIVAMHFYGSTTAPRSHALHNPSCARVVLREVITDGYFTKNESVLWDGTWGKYVATNSGISGIPYGTQIFTDELGKYMTPLYNQHKNVYGREVLTDAQGYEANVSFCYFECGAAIIGQWRNTASASGITAGYIGHWAVANIGSDQHWVDCRFGVPPWNGTDDRQNMHALTIDLGESSYQELAVVGRYGGNIIMTNCHVRCDNGVRYGAKIRRCSNLNWRGNYSETQSGYVTKLVTGVISAVQSIAPPNPFIGMRGDTAEYNHDTIGAIDLNIPWTSLWDSNFTINALVTTSTGSASILSLIDNGLGFVRLLMSPKNMTGTFTVGQTLTQAAGQLRTYPLVADATMQQLLMIGKGNCICTAPGYTWQNDGSYFATPGATIHQSTFNKDGVHLTHPSAILLSSGSSLSVYTDKTTDFYGVMSYGNRYRWDSNAVYPYNAADLGSVTRPWTRLLAGPGSAAAPAISFAADPDTGIYRPSANVLSIAAGGVQGPSFSDQGVSFDGGIKWFKLNRVVNTDGSAWLPVLYGSTTAGTPTYTTQACDYAIVGDLIFLHIRINLATKTGVAGEVRVSLPFNNEADTFHAKSFNIQAFANWTGLTAGPLNMVDALSNVNFIRFKQQALSTTTGNGADTILTDVNLTDTTNFRLWTFICVNR